MANAVAVTPVERISYHLSLSREGTRKRSCSIIRVSLDATADEGSKGLGQSRFVEGV